MAEREGRWCCRRQRRRRGRLQDTNKEGCLLLKAQEHELVEGASKEGLTQRAPIDLNRGALACRLVTGVAPMGCSSEAAKIEREGPDVEEGWADGSNRTPGRLQQYVDVAFASKKNRG